MWKETDDCLIYLQLWSEFSYNAMTVIKEADFNWYEYLCSLLIEQIMSIIEG